MAYKNNDTSFGGVRGIFSTKTLSGNGAKNWELRFVRTLFSGFWGTY